MGWLPTDFFQEVRFSNGTATYDYGMNNVPEVELMRIVLPKAYKTLYYYRVYITETVYFKDPVVLNFNQYTPMDRFVSVSTPTPMVPGANEGPTHNQDSITRPNNQGGVLP